MKGTTMDLSPEEKQLVTATQADLATAKEALRGAANKMRQMAKINREAGRAKASNAAMRFEGVLIRVRGELHEAHADAGDALCDCFDDGGPVILGGGGGR